MKKKQFVIVVLILAMILSMFTGCTSEPEPLRICIDLEFLYGSGKSHTIDIAMFDLESSLIHTVGLTEDDFIIEYVPRTGAERESALDRIRTEIMSGGGPDVFIMHCAGGEVFTAQEEAIFLQPEKAMELGLFLPLDEYIENAQYAEWDKFTPAVMTGGKNWEGQQLVPLTYSVPTVIYLASDFSHTPSNMTWDEMLNDEELFETAARLGDAQTMVGMMDYPIDYILGDLADYTEEELAFTEEELLAHVNTIFELTHHTLENDSYSEPNWSESSIGVGFNTAGPYREMQELNGIGESDTYSLVPLYSDDGGCTAMVLTYAAINRNTERPQDAFNVLDCLLATTRQMNSDLFTELIYRSARNVSMPIHEELMTAENRILAGVWPLSDENFATLSAVRDQITNVQFAGQLNITLQNMMSESLEAAGRGEDYSGIVHEAYETMEKMMAE